MKTARKTATKIMIATIATAAMKAKRWRVVQKGLQPKRKPRGNPTLSALTVTVMATVTVKLKAKVTGATKATAEMIPMTAMTTMKATVTGAMKATAAMIPMTAMTTMKAKR